MVTIHLTYFQRVVSEPLDLTPITGAPTKNRTWNTALPWLCYAT